MNTTKALHFRLLHSLLPREDIDKQLENTQLLSWVFFSMLAYQNPEYIARIREHMGFARVEFYTFNSMQAFLVETEKHVVVSFRGTEFNKLSDLKTILSFDRASFQNTSAHKGFVQSLTPVADRIRYDVLSAHKNKKVCYTGHSMGGALALLMTLHHAPDKVVTFGAPKIFSKKETLQELQAVDIRMFANKLDVVSHIPPGFTGYKHGATVLNVPAPGRWYNLVKNHRLEAYLNAALIG